MFSCAQEVLLFMDIKGVKKGQHLKLKRSPRGKNGLGIGYGVTKSSLEILTKFFWLKFAV